jgi:hypothetical protein
MEMKWKHVTVMDMKRKLPSAPRACQIDLMNIGFTFNFLLLRNRFHYYDIYFDIISSTREHENFFCSLVYQLPSDVICFLSFPSLFF